MSDLIEVTPSAYGCPLLIRRLLEAGVAAAPTQQIVYADRSRHTYLDLRERVSQPASGLVSVGKHDRKVLREVYAK